MIFLLLVVALTTKALVDGDAPEPLEEGGEPEHPSEFHAKVCGHPVQESLRPEPIRRLAPSSE